MSRSRSLPPRPPSRAQWVRRRRCARWRYWACRVGVALGLAVVVLLGLVWIREHGAHPRPWGQVKADTTRAALLILPILGSLWDALLGPRWNDPDTWWAPVPLAHPGSAGTGRRPGGDLAPLAGQ